MFSSSARAVAQMASGVLSARVVAQSICTTPRSGSNAGDSDSSDYDSEVEAVSMDHAISLVSSWAAGAAAAAPVTDANDDTYLADHLILPYADDASAPHHLIAYWFRIFEYLGPDPHACLHLRCLCRLYLEALPPPFVMYPRDAAPADHHNDNLRETSGPARCCFMSMSRRYEQNLVHPTLDALFAHLRAKPSSARPQWIVIRAGTHAIEGDGYLGLACPVTRIMGAGASASQTTLFGSGLHFSDLCVGTEWRRIVLRNLTIRDAAVYGVLFNLESPANARIEVSDVRVEGSFSAGLMANRRAQVVCENCAVTGCREAGIKAIQGAHITIQGAQTSVTGNCLYTAGYDVQVTGAGSTIVLRRPCGLQRTDCGASSGGTVTVVEDQGASVDLDTEQKVGALRT